MDERLSNINFYNTITTKQAKAENYIHIYYAVGNANTQTQENELAEITKKPNSAGWNLISTSTATIDT